MAQTATSTRIKYYFPFLVLLTLLFFLFFSTIEFPWLVGVGLLVLILLTLFLGEYSVFRNNFEADFKMRSHKRKMTRLSWVLAILYTIMLGTTDPDTKDFYIIALFWTFPLVEVIMHFLYKQGRPYTLFIKNNELLLNRRSVQKRDLTQLNRLQYDRFSKEFKLCFDSKYSISIPTSEYTQEDLHQLLEILLEKSKSKLSIPQNWVSQTENSVKQGSIN